MALEKKELESLSDWQRRVLVDAEKYGWETLVSSHRVGDAVEVVTMSMVKVDHDRNVTTHINVTAHKNRLRRDHHSASYAVDSDEYRTITLKEASYMLTLEGRAS